MAFEKIKQMISNVKGKMMDDEGLFQGGKYGRVGGRFKDMMDSTVQDQSGRAGRDLTEMFGQQDIGPGGVTDLTSSMFSEGDPRLSQDFSMARQGAFDFDPSDPNDVLMIQKRINKLLPEVSQLDEDSMFGPKTESALRMVQGMMNKEGGQGGLMGFLPDAISGGFAEPSMGMSGPGDAYSQASAGMDSFGLGGITPSRDSVDSYGSAPADDYSMGAGMMDTMGLGGVTPSRDEFLNPASKGRLDATSTIQNVPWMKGLADKVGY